MHEVERGDVFHLCRCTAVFVTQPLDLIKNRMQLSGKPTLIIYITRVCNEKSCFCFMYIHK